jgi:hypothetical protein
MVHVQKASIFEGVANAVAVLLLQGMAKVAVLLLLLRKIEDHVLQECT